MTKPSVSLEKKNGSGVKPTPKIYWAVLFDRMTHWRAVRSIIRVSMVCGKFDCINLSVDQKRTDLTRDELISDFRRQAQNPDDVLVMLDNDHELPPETVLQLASSEFGVTAALAFRRGKPYDPIMFLRCGDGKLHPIAQWDKGVIVQCDMVGHGAIAIKRKVFDDLEAHGYHAPFYRYTYPEGGARPSEDMYFGETCEKSGIPMYCDTRLVIPHLIDDAVDDSRWQQWLVDNPSGVASSLTYGSDVPQLKVSIIIPTHNRPEQIQKCLDQLFSTIQGRDVEVIVVTDDTYLKDNRVKLISILETDAITKWNRGLAYSTGDAIVLGADDLWFTDGWLDAALRGLNAFPDQCGMVGLNDGARDGNELATHYLMSRDYIAQYNGGVLACPDYHHLFIDLEATARAKRAGRYFWAYDALVEHRHYLFGKAPLDETYQKSASFFEEDQKTFQQRALQGFPDDFEPVLEAIR